MALALAMAAATGSAATTMPVRAPGSPSFDRLKANTTCSSHIGRTSR